MIKTFLKRRISLRIIAMVLTFLLTVPLLNACSRTQASVPPPVDDSRIGAVTNRQPAKPPEVKKGLSNTQKVVILAGAAALYYLYNKHQNSQQEGPEGQYYLSKNGRVYYRDAQHRAHWVTPPPEGIQVPESEAKQYQDFQGYNNRATGRDLTGLASSAAIAP